MSWASNTTVYIIRTNLSLCGRIAKDFGCYAKKLICSHFKIISVRLENGQSKANYMRLIVVFVNSLYSILIYIYYIFYKCGFPTTIDVETNTYKVSS